MKPIRRITGAALALTMAMSLTLPALAATYDVEDSAQVIEAVEGKSNADGDRTVILNMKNDITMESPVETVKDWTYTIKGNGHSLKNVSVQGDGTMDIQADISNGENWYGLQTDGNAVVTVTGDISATGDQKTAVETKGNSNVTVTGDVSVTGNDSFVVNAFGGASITVTGDITADGRDNYGIAVQQATGTVNGNISADAIGVGVAGNGTLTVTGDVSSKDTGAVIINNDQGDCSLTINGDVHGDRYGLNIETDGQASATVEITGNISSYAGNLIDAHNGASIHATVTGDTRASGQNCGPAWALDAGHGNSQIQLTQKGNISSEGRDAIRAFNGSDSGSIILDLEGTVSSPDRKSQGIRVSGESENASIDISLDGKLEGVICRYQDEYEKTPLTVTYREPEQSRISVPGKTLPAVFTAEDLEGRTVSSEEDMILIYFDPADPESLEALRKGQETASQGETVFGVCLTEDYAGARALMEEAGAEYPVLKCSDSLRAILTAHGGATPVTIVVREGKFQTPAKNSTSTVYVEKDLEIVPIEVFN